MEGTICASQCGIILTKSLQFADKRAEKGDHSRMARMLPSMTEDERSDAREAAGQMPRKATECVNIAIGKSMAQPASSSSSSRYHKVKAPPRPSTAPEPEAEKKPRKQGG